VHNNYRFSPAYAWFVVAVLSLANCVSFIDRLILSLLVGPIKAELALSDTRVGLLQGAAFALFYCIAGLYLARLADRSNRKWIITGGITLWCVMTTLSGTARNFWQLFLYRIGVGVGEGTLSPSAYSLIAGYFPRDRLALAVGVYGAGISAGVGLAYLVGGVAIQWVAGLGTVDLPLLPPLSGWRLVFAVVGLLGLPVAVLMLFVREPPREPGSRPASLHEVAAHLRANWRSLILALAGYGATSITIYSIFSWTPTFFVRQYGASIAAAATALGVIALAGGLSGAFLGGAYSDRLERGGDPHAKLRVLFYCCAGLLLPAIIAPFMPTMLSSAAVLFFTFFFGSAATGPAGAYVQAITPDRMRAQFGALYQLSLSLVGATLGPLLTALFTDFVFRDEALLGYSLSSVAVVGNVLAVTLTALALRAALQPRT
jgi:MFS family permease